MLRVTIRVSADNDYNSQTKTAKQKKAANNRGFLNASTTEQRLTRRPSPPPRHTPQVQDDLQAQRMPLALYHRHGSHT